MPLINFVELRRLVTELDAVEHVIEDGSAGPGSLRRREDLRYTLCVWVGVRDPRLALARARDLLAARPDAGAPAPTHAQTQGQAQAPEPTDPGAADAA